MKVQHIVLTRFSMPVIESWRRKAYGDEANRKQWLEYRARLLESTLAPSLRAQTLAPRAFLICAPQDRELLAGRLDTSLFTPLYAHCTRSASELMREHGVSGMVAVTRIDSDDLVSRTYFEQVDRAIARNPSQRWLVAVNGYRSDFSLLQRIYYKCSPLVTLLTADFQGQDVYGVQHEQIQDCEPIHGAEWMQAIHASNIGNNFCPSPVPLEVFERRRASNPKQVATHPMPLDRQWFAEWSGFQAPAALPASYY